MKKNSFITLVLSVISILTFGIGMCMALIPEWNAFKQGIVFGSVGIVLGLITVIIYRKMSGKAPIEISGKMLLTLAVAVLGALTLGTGMCFTMVWNRMTLGIIIGLVGIVILLSLIPLVKGLED